MNEKLKKAIREADYPTTYFLVHWRDVRHHYGLSKRDAYRLVRQFRVGNLAFEPFNDSPLPLP